MAPRLSTWDHKSDKDLLLTIIEMGTLKSIMWPEIADRMKAKGYTFTKEACRQHFQKIRKESQGGKNNDNNSPARTPKATNNPTTPSKSTPQKRGMSQNGSFASGYDDEDDEEEMNQSAKRQKIKPEDNGCGYGGQSAPLFKVEDGRPIDLENDDIYEAEYI